MHPQSHLTHIKPKAHFSAFAAPGLYNSQVKSSLISVKVKLQQSRHAWRAQPPEPPGPAASAAASQEPPPPPLEPAAPPAPLPQPPTGPLPAACRSAVGVLWSLLADFHALDLAPAAWLGRIPMGVRGGHHAPLLFQNGRLQLRPPSTP
jgi:hypothetical protein